MKIIKHPESAFMKLTAVFLIFSLVLMTVGILGFVGSVKAANLLNVRDTITNSAPAGTSNHNIQFGAESGLTAGQTIIITFDPATNAFNLGTLGVGDTTASGFTVVSACGAGASEVTMATTNDPDRVTFTVCSGDSISSGSKQVQFQNNKITNPSTVQSYVVRIQWGPNDSGDTRVAIVEPVSVTAQVETTLVFTVTGVGNGVIVNGTPTTGTTSATSIPFGVLEPGVPKFMAQQLTVGTNALNGFVVTVRQNQNLLSANGADIDLFIDGNATPTPGGWQSPSNNIANENTWGHYGVTSDDTDLNGGEFNGGRFAGNIDTARQIFSHTGPADETTPDIGRARVGYRIEITALQEAANDYNNILTYVCTPTF